MRILVTGGSGFIGSHVARRLVADGHEVTRLGRRGVPPCDPAPGRFVVGDLGRSASAEEAFEGQEVVVHCAGPMDALHGVAGCGIGPTSAAVAMAADRKVGRFVHLSSLAVCAPPLPGQHLHERSPLSSHPSWNRYARLKVAEERIVRVAHENGSLPIVMLRPGITFGPGDRHATPLFRRALILPAPFLVGSGRNTVATVAVEDLADAVSRAVNTPGIEGRCYPLAGNDRVTQRDLFDFHASELGLRPPSRSLPLWAALSVAASCEALYRVTLRGEPSITRTGVWIIGSRSSADTSRAAIDLGWHGTHSIADVIARAIRSTGRPTAGSVPFLVSTAAGARKVFGGAP